MASSRGRPRRRDHARKRRRQAASATLRTARLPEASVPGSVSSAIVSRRVSHREPQRRQAAASPPGGP